MRRTSCTGRHRLNSTTELPEAALERLADADAYVDLGLDRRPAFCAVRGLPDTTLPLFAQVDGAGRPLPEMIEPHFALTRLKEGQEVVVDTAASSSVCGAIQSHSCARR